MTTNWTLIAGFIVLVLAAALVRERWRVSRIEQWARDRGFRRRPSVPPDEPEPATSLVRRVNPHGARIWGLVLDGGWDGVPVTIGEHESSRGAGKSGEWFTVVVWPIVGAEGPVVAQHQSGSAAGDAVLATLTGGPDEARKARQVRTEGRWVVEGEPEPRDRWLTPDTASALDGWSHGGAFVRDAGHGAWRLRGGLSVARLEALRAQFPAARRLLD